jgi:twitching motility protein PilT
VKIRELLQIAVERRASDLHLRVSSPPVVRIDGALHHLENQKPLSPADLEAIYEEVAEHERRKAFAVHHELDFSCSFPGLTRCRVNVLQQRGTLSIAVRLIPFTVPTIEELHLPRVCSELALKPLGLILITGPTGSGKSSTIAAMIDYLNATQSRNIIAIEDPVEYVHTNKKSIIAQRDVGHDTESFDIALVHALRHDPDVIVVGEIRELPTMETALRAAETGHLVMGTLHTSDTTQTINRVIDMFPAGQQDQVRSHLAQTLAGVLCQTLLPRLDGVGRVPAFEVMLANNPVRNLIREGRNHQIYSVLQVSKKEGMQTLNQSLAELVVSKTVSENEACTHSTNVDELKTLCSYLKH